MALRHGGRSLLRQRAVSRIAAVRLQLDARMLGGPAGFRQSTVTGAVPLAVPDSRSRRARQLSDEVIELREAQR